MDFPFRQILPHGGLVTLGGFGETTFTLAAFRDDGHGAAVDPMLEVLQRMVNRLVLLTVDIQNIKTKALQFFSQATHGKHETVRVIVLSIVVIDENAQIVQIFGRGKHECLPWNALLQFPVSHQAECPPNTLYFLRHGKADSGTDALP